MSTKINCLRYARSKAIITHPMTMLFDSLGPEWRAPDVVDAIRRMADEGQTERGAVFTRREVVDTVLDLSGYTPDRPLHRLRLLETSFGDGDFLLPALDRLLRAFTHFGGDWSTAHIDLVNAIRAVELHRESYTQTLQRVRQRLVDAGIGAEEAKALGERWLLCDDFLLAAIEGEFDFVVGNPPYVRQERIPAALLTEYRSRYRTLFDRADLYIPFYERALDLLAPDGTLGFICANRWIKNKYGGPLRRKIAERFHLSRYIDMGASDAFHAQVIAYPAITIIKRPARDGVQPEATWVANKSAEGSAMLSQVARAMVAHEPDPALIDLIEIGADDDAPWLLDDVPRLRLLRRLESELPTLEQAGCKVGIGVATGCDRVFIAAFDELPVEPERKLPLAMARDLIEGQLRWGGKGVLNPYEPDGTLADLSRYPKFAAYLAEHHTAIAARHVASRSGDGWYRTIDRIYPELVTREKLLVPDIKGEAVFVLDEGRYYPHHNLYYVTSDTWDLRALQTVLRSSITVMTVATYCTRMAGGFLRFQAQYLRRIRVPVWSQVSETLRAELIAASASRSQGVVDAPVFTLYGLSTEEGTRVRQFADKAQVTPARKAAAQ